MALDKKKFKLLCQESAENAAISFTKLTRVPTKISIIQIQQTQADKQFKSLSPDAFVTAVSLPIRGDLKGSAMLMFPKHIAIKLTQLLTHKSASSLHGFDEMEVSALKEVANIICGSFLTVIANRLDIHVVEHLPFFMFDTLASVLNQLSLRAEDNKESAPLLIEIRFEFEDTDVSGYVLLAFGVNQIQVLSEALNRAHF